MTEMLCGPQLGTDTQQVGGTHWQFTQVPPPVQLAEVLHWLEGFSTHWPQMQFWHALQGEGHALGTHTLLTQHSLLLQQVAGNPHGSPYGTHNPLMQLSHCPQVLGTHTPTMPDESQFWHGVQKETHSPLTQCLQALASQTLFAQGSQD
jgi:hypothetical protein